MKNLILILMLFVFAGPARAEVVTGLASWYSSKDACGPKTNNLAGCPTASTKSIHRLEAQGYKFVAINRFNFWDMVKITNIDTGKWTYAYVLDRGGFDKYGRVADLSKKVFNEIADDEDGVIRVKIQRVKK